MDESGDIALEYIMGIVESVRTHWEFLAAPYAPLGIEVAPFYRQWFTNYFGADAAHMECVRQRILEHGGKGLAVAGLIPELWEIWSSRHASDDDNFERSAIRGHAAWNAWELAVKATKEPLSDAELNGLGWHLTTLAAMSDGQFRETLCSLQRKAGQKGGRRSAAVRSVEFDDRANETCRQARALLRERLHTPSDIVRILAGRTGKSRPTIIKHLRTEGLYPPEKKRKPS
ncbi:hypothetical protein ACSMFT_07745 [Ectopseudomonas oleovorans]|uniref:hypothetical protein n=1 Tax=Ectopseudomonas oleovorans TaxID=301 RepID=UPI003F1B36ED